MTTTDTDIEPAYVASTELEFRVWDERCFIIVESDRANCEFEVRETIQQSDGTLLVFLVVRGAEATRVRDAAREWPTIAEARVVTQVDDTALLEFVVSRQGLAATVADSRAIPRTIAASQGEGRVVVEVPPHVDPQHVIETFQTRHPDSELHARRQTGISLFSQEEFAQSILGQLTAKQREALVTAYTRGYFDRPRKSTAAACADALDISQSTFSQHLRVGLRKVLAALLESQLDMREFESG